MAMELRLVMLCALALVKGAINAVTFEHGVTGLVVRTMSAEPVLNSTGEIRYLVSRWQLHEV